MLERIKIIITDELRKNDVSLSIIFNKQGEILWHEGRPIKGKTIDQGRGFSKSLLRKVIAENLPLEEKNVTVSFSENKDETTESTKKLQIRSVLIQPIADYYFYIDSGIKNRFDQKDIKNLNFIGKLLSECLEHIKVKTKDTGGITGNSSEINIIREQVVTYSLEDEPVLMLGETGVGKSHIAKLIHHYSGRKGKFIIVDTPNIQDKLFDTILFGHKKGAFTDAISNKRGLVEEASGGTLFFDEIAEIPLDIQTKLLRFIETKKYYKLGDSEEHRVDVRIIAASNKDFRRSLKNGEFRSDLYYRISVLEIEIPPLRNRKTDMKEFVTENTHFLKGKKIANSFWNAIYDYSWPGNIRELNNVLIRAGICCQNPITGSDIKRMINKSTTSTTSNDESDEVISAEKIYKDIIGNKKNFWEVVKKPFLKRDINRATVKEIIKKGLGEENVHFKYKNLLVLFNMEEKDYQKFMTFLRDYDLK